MALDSCAQFLAVTEHRLIPSRALSCMSPTSKSWSSFCLGPACQDKSAGGHAGVGVVNLGGDCPAALAASQACCVTDRLFTPHFSVIACFRIDAWMADVACPIACQPIYPACWMDTPDRSSSSSTRIVQDVWDVYRYELGVVPDDVVLALRDAVSRSAVDDFWSIWGSNAKAGFFRAYALAGCPTAAGSFASLGKGQLRIRSRRLGGRAVGGTASSRLYRVCHNDEVDKHCDHNACHCSFVGVSSPLLMFSKVLGVRGLLSLGGMLC